MVSQELISSPYFPLMPDVKLVGWLTVGVAANPMNAKVLRMIGLVILELVANWWLIFGQIWSAACHRLGFIQICLAANYHPVSISGRKRDSSVVHKLSVIFQNWTKLLDVCSQQFKASQFKEKVQQWARFLEWLSTMFEFGNPKLVGLANR